VSANDQSFGQSASRSRELELKLDLIERWLGEARLGGLLLSTQRNFAWLTGGGDNHVGLATEIGVASLLVLAGGRRFVLAPNNECPRLLDEELDGLGFEPIELPWYELRADPLRLRASIAGLADPERIGADAATAGLPNVESMIAPLRYRLTEAEVARYRVHARATAEAVEAVAREIAPGMTEREVEARLAGRLIECGARPTVLLVAGDERFFKYRHPIPTAKRIDRSACLAVCARRWGLTAAVSRLVHFGAVADETARRYASLGRIEARLVASTRPGARSGDLMDRLAGWYAEEGFADEWRWHHQGGATGYLEREWVICPDGAQRVESPQAFAWNPTIAGTKIEDTILATEDSAEILSATASWPSIEIEVNGEGWVRPQILRR
jgi:Xaa-Pro aminopeptidase